MRERPLKFIDSRKGTLETCLVSPTRPTDDEQQRELVASLRSVRDDARDAHETRPSMPERVDAVKTAAALPKIAIDGDAENVSSPPREDLNSLWNVADAFAAKPQGFLGKLFAPFRRSLQRFALGSVFERQVQMNSAQVRFDNEVIEYVDARLDRMGRHYDRVLGLHGKRMEEIDERHLILQQELIRHVHDLVERIEFVFETAETNHLQIDAALRETREELKDLAKRLETLAAPSLKEP